MVAKSYEVFKFEIIVNMSFCYSNFTTQTRDECPVPDWQENFINLKTQLTMTRFFPLIIFSLVLICCKTPSTGTHTGSTAKKRIIMRTDSTLSRNRVPDAGDSVQWVGSQVVPITARRQSTPDPIEGVWILDSMQGRKIPDPSGLKTDKIPEATTDGGNGVKEKSNDVSESQNISGETRITPPQGSRFHLPEKPRISFFGGNETFSGFTGCNKFAGRFHISAPDKIVLSNATPSTRMVCIGDYDEDEFIKTLHQVNRFLSVGNTLTLLSGNNPILVFNRTNMK